MNLAPLRFLGRLFQQGRSADPAVFGTFLHDQGAYVAQKTVLDYCQVKAGRHQARLFAEAEFQAALRHCRWQVYFGALADVTAVAEAWLRPLAPGAEPALAEALARLHDHAFASEPPPPEEAAAREGFSIRAHLAGLQTRPPQPSHLMPLLAEAPLFATLPIHPANRAGEAPSIRGALRFHIVSTRQEMERRFVPDALLASLLA
jgi:hypothetical protein